MGCWVWGLRRLFGVRVGLGEVVLGLRGVVSGLARWVWGVIFGCVSGGQLGFVGCRVGFWVSVGRVCAWRVWFCGSGGLFKVWAGLGAQIFGLGGLVVGLGVVSFGVWFWGLGGTGGIRGLTKNSLGEGHGPRKT